MADFITLRALLRDPRYWRDRDPAVIALVEAAWKQAFGAKGAGA